MSDSNTQIGTVEFEQIPGTWAVPGSYTEIHDLPAPGTLAGMPLRCVVIGQLPGGAGAPATVYQNVSVADAQRLGGVGSVVAQAVAAFSTEMPTLSIDLVGVSPVSGGVAASTTFAFSGTATSGGTAAVQIGGTRVSFPVAAGATAVQAAQAMVAACNVTAVGSSATTLAIATGVSVAMAQNGSSVTVTAGETGAHTNSIDVRVSTALADQVPGLTVSVSAMRNGAGAPDITPALQALGATWYTDIILTLNDQANISAAVQEAHRRGNAMVAQDCRVWCGYQGTQGQILALASQFCTYEELVLIGEQSARWSPWVAAAVAGAQGAQSLNADPARQLRGLPLNGLAGLGPDPGARFTQAQRNVLLTNGCTTFTVARDGTVTLERVVTTRTIDPTSQVASGIWDVMKPAIGARVRYEWNTYFEANFYTAKLADDGSPLANTPGVVTCRTLHGSWGAQCLLYQAQGWIDDAKTTVAQSYFVRDMSDRSRVNSNLVISAMSSLIVLANRLELQG